MMCAIFVEYFVRVIIHICHRCDPSARECFHACFSSTDTIQTHKHVNKQTNVSQQAYQKHLPTSTYGHKIDAWNETILSFTCK